jgi:hypothetical protein
MAEEATGQGNEGLVDVSPAFVADRDTPQLLQQRKTLLHHPAVRTQPIRGVDANPGDAVADPPDPQRSMAARDSVVRVRVDRAGSPATPAARGAGGRNGVDQCLEPHGVVPVGGFAPGHQWQAPGIGHEMDLPPWFGVIGRVGTETSAPRLAGMLALSAHTRSHATASAVPTRSSRPR